VGVLDAGEHGHGFIVSKPWVVLHHQMKDFFVVIPWVSLRTVGSMSDRETVRSNRE